MSQQTKIENFNAKYSLHRNEVLLLIKVFLSRRHLISLNLCLITEIMLTTNDFTKAVWVSSRIFRTPVWMLVIYTIRVFKASFHVYLMNRRFQ